MIYQSAFRLLLLLVFVGASTKPGAAQENRNTGSSWLHVGFGLSKTPDWGGGKGFIISVNRDIGQVWIAQAAFHFDTELDQRGSYVRTASIGIGLSSHRRRWAVTVGPGITFLKTTGWAPSWVRQDPESYTIAAIIADIKAMLLMRQRWGIGIDLHANMNQENNLFAARLVLAFTLL